MRLPRFTLHGFRPPREVLGLAFGKLERQVMRVIWQRGDATVRDVHGLFEERLAYTTLMTTLDRLHKKGLLARRRQGRAFVYAPRVTPEQLTRGAAQDLVAGLLDNGSAATAPMLACIVDAVSDHDRALLDELDRLIQEKKQELRNKD